MNAEYRELFQMVAQNAAINAENGMDAFLKDNSGDHTEEISDLEKARKRLNEIEDKLKDPNSELNKADYLMLYTGAMVCATILEKNVTTLTAVIKEYRENLIPRLKEVLLLDSLVILRLIHEDPYLPLEMCLDLYQYDDVQLQQVIV